MQHRDKKIHKLQDLGVFKTSDAIKIGVSQPTLSRLASKGVIIRLERGLFVHSDGLIEPSDMSFAIASAKFGKSSYIGGISALFRHGLITQVPDQVWVITPPSAKSLNKLYRCLRTGLDLTIGIKDYPFYRMSTLDRTVIDALHFSTKMGVEIAIGAARKALKEGLTNEPRLYEMACNIGTVKSFEKYWEAMISA